MHHARVSHKYAMHSLKPFRIPLFQLAVASAFSYCCSCCIHLSSTIANHLRNWNNDSERWSVIIILPLDCHHPTLIDTIFIAYLNDLQGRTKQVYFNEYVCIHIVCITYPSDDTNLFEHFVWLEMIKEKCNNNNTKKVRKDISTEVVHIINMTILIML